MPGPLTISNSRFDRGVLTGDDRQQLRRRRHLPRQSTAGRRCCRATAARTARRRSTSPTPPRRATPGTTRRTTGWVRARGRQRMDRADAGVDRGRSRSPTRSYFEPEPTANTWWSIPIPGKWRTNPQADNWFYQGKSISGNRSARCGTATAAARSTSTRPADRLHPACSQIAIHIKRTARAACRCRGDLEHLGAHRRRPTPSDAMPILDQRPAGRCLLQAQPAGVVALPTTWFGSIQAGTVKGISFYVDLNQPDNQLGP